MLNRSIIQNQAFLDFNKRDNLIRALSFKSHRIEYDQNKNGLRYEYGDNEDWIIIG